MIIINIFYFRLFLNLENRSIYFCEKPNSVKSMIDSIDATLYLIEKLHLKDIDQVIGTVKKI